MASVSLPLKKASFCCNAESSIFEQRTTHAAHAARTKLFQDNLMSYSIVYLVTDNTSQWCSLRLAVSRPIYR